MQPKHLKIFSFPENSISGKYLFSGKYFTLNQTQPKNLRTYMPENKKEILKTKRNLYYGHININRINKIIIK